MNSIFRTALFLWACLGSAQASDWISYPGGEGPGKGRHVVFLSGDEEYRSEEGLPLLARLLSEKHGFRTSVLFSVNPETGEIDPNRQDSLTGAEALDSADAIVMLLRFRAWPYEKMQHFVDAFHRGVPIIALRTSTHAFQFPKEHGSKAYNRFGETVLGEEWVSHWGRHKVEGTLGIVEPGQKDHPILRSVGSIYGDTDVYEAHPPADATILLRGQVLKSLDPTSGPADYSKKRATDGAMQPVNDPMMPIAWTREYRNTKGTTNRIFCTTMGAATDLQSEGLRRCIVNAVFWGLELPVPAKANVDIPKSFQPTPYGFNGFRKGIQPESVR